jgi:hypothetical protein
VDIFLIIHLRKLWIKISFLEHVCSKEKGEPSPRKFSALFDLRKIIPKFHTQASEQKVKCF